MTYFAFEGGVGQDAVGGAVEITAAQYAAAIEGMQDGKLVTVAGGQFAVLDKPVEPEPEPVEEPQPPTIEDYRIAINNHVDKAARSRDYNDAATLAGYVSGTVPTWAGEAAAFVTWRDAVWSHALAELDKVLSGEREQPTVEALIAELPKLVWPA